jgi:hypothetical protein
VRKGETVTEQPLFYVVLLGLIVIVYAQIANKKEKPARQQSKALEEFEQTVELFASDLEEQNESLANLFNDTRRDYELHLAKQTGKIESLEKQAQEMAREMAHLKRALGEGEAVAAASRVPAPDAGGQAAGADKPPAAKVAARGGAKRAATAGAAPQPQQDDAVSAPALPTLKERYPELFEMHDGGKSIEYIAKKLGKNKGEVSLILMLSRQEEAAR